MTCYSSYDEDTLEAGDLLVIEDVSVEDGFQNASEESLENENLKKKTKIQVDMAIDTEFKDSTYLSLQVSVNFFVKGEEYSFSYVVFNDRYKMYLTDALTNVPEHVKIYYDNFKGDHVGLFYFYKLLYEKFSTELFEYSFDFLLYFYYSPRDLILFFGKDVLDPIFVKNSSSYNQNIVQRRSLLGTLSFDFPFQGNVFKSNFFLKDFFGIEAWGLSTLIESSGIVEEKKKKELMEPYKNDMELALFKFPNEFFMYSLNDSEVLLSIAKIKIDSYNAILKETFKIKDEKALFNKYSFPFTMGRLAYKMWQIYLNHVIYKNDPVLILASYKLGVLNPVHKNHPLNLEAFNFLKKFDSLASLRGFLNTDPQKFEEIYSLLSARDVFNYSAQTFSSIKYLVDTSTQDYRYLLAATSGGRTINERPKECFIDYGADVDILSAYGQVLCSIYFPLGRSRIFTKTSNCLKKMTLGAFMDKYLEKMKKYKLFKILVTGKLSFEQDLIHSKIISEVGAKRKVEHYSSLEVGEQAISSEFILLRKEIINGSITFSTWEILEKVCTSKEMKEIRDLEVVSAIYHLDEDACFTIEEFLDHVLADKGEFSFDLKKSTTIDNRTYKFFPFPMKEFIGPLVEKRSILKKMKSDPLAQAQSHALKTLNNTYWGISTSVFFETNNVIFSEEVSNSTRNNVWLISKSLNTHMSITDGGPFSLMNVSFFKDPEGKKPGLHCLSSYYYYSKHRNIRMGPLGGIDWKSYVEKNIPPTDPVFASLNDIAYKHIKNFWKTYNLDISFSVEMKIERTPFRRAAYWSKAHYGMQIYCSDTKSYSKEEYTPEP